MAKKTGGKKKSHSRKRSKASQKGQQNTVKGRVAEEITARMYNAPLRNVERNAKLSPLNRDSKLTRDIDVLLSSRVVSKPSARKAIECKNLDEKVDVEKIDAFVGKLQDVGIPHDHGIYVSTGGYTKDALDRAKPVGVKLLKLTGLTEDRLDSLKSPASQFCVFYLAQVTGFTVTNNVSTGIKAEELISFYDETDKPCGTVLDLIWNAWQEGEPKSEAGEYKLALKLPAGWHQFIDGKNEPVLAVTATVNVWALALKFIGTSTDHALIDAAEGKLEKRQINASFDIPLDDKAVHSLHTFRTEAELKTFINEPQGVKLTTRTRLPRIQWMNACFYPLSQRVAALLKDSMEDFNESDAEDPPMLNISEVEGSDLRAMWEPLGEGYPGNVMPVVITDKKGDAAIDVTALLRAKEYKKVIALREHLETNPNPVLAEVIHNAYIAQGGLLLSEAEKRGGAEAKRLLSRARLQVEAAIRIKPDSADAFHNLGIVYKELNRYKEALSCFDHALAIDPDFFITWVNRAKVLVKLGRIEEAVASYDRALSLQPENIEIIFHRSVLQGELGKFEESVAGFTEVLKVAPDHGRALHYYGLGLVNLGRYEDALASFDRALKSKENDAKFWTHRGMALQGLSRYEESLECYDKALALNPTGYDVLLNRGSVLSALGRDEEAVESFDRSFAHVEGHDMAWNTRGTTLHRLGRVDEALESYRRAVEIKPDNRAALMNSGLALIDLGRFEEAVRDFNEVLRLEPEHVPALHSRGLAFYLLGRHEEALADYERALSLHGDAFDTWVNKGLVLAELGEFDDAIIAANNGVRLAPEEECYARPLIARAKVYHLAGRPADAAVDIIAAWKLDSDLVLALEECRDIFVEAYHSIASPSDEHSLLYREVRKSVDAVTDTHSDMEEAAIQQAHKSAGS
jgi:tetratricopeptide (TPR) repeat protein